MRELLMFSVSVALLLALAVDPARAGLVGHWKFDEGGGTMAADSSGNASDGSLEDAAGMEWVEGIHGGALSFDGAGFVSVPAEAWSSITTQFTVAFWILGSDSQPLDGWCFGAWGGDARIASCHVPWSDGTIYFDSGAAGLAERISKPAAADEYRGQWRHWTFVKDADTGEKKIYLDGVLWHSGTGFTDSAEGVTEFYIGAGRANERYPYTGLIDDFRLYDHALSEVEVLGAMAGEPWPYASGPNPRDGAMIEATSSHLSWRTGDFAVSHDVYFGDSLEDVNQATAESDAFQGSQTATEFPVQGLTPGATYYWRVDEVNDANAASPWKGDIWSFWVQPAGAWDPSCSTPSTSARALTRSARR